MEAVAKHEFNATEDDELSFSRGDILKVVNCEEDANWYKAELHGREGFVPNNYIELKPHEWYVGGMTRSAAEKLLLQKKGNSFLQPDGAFLVRNSESTAGDFSMSVKYGDAVQHFKILRDGIGKYFLWVVKHNSINELVDYHRNTSISKTQTIKLINMCPEGAEQKCQAMYDFTPQDHGELELRKGDVVSKEEEVDRHWWRGINKRTGHKGLYPANYVKLDV